MRTTVRPVASRVSAGADLLDWVRGLLSLAFVLFLPLLALVLPFPPVQKKDCYKSDSLQPNREELIGF